LSGDAQFGLHLGESLQLAALGIVGEIIKSSKTVGEAVTNAAALVEHVTSWFNMTVTKNSKVFTIHINPLKADWRSNVPAVQMLDVLMVLVIHELDGLLLHKITPLSVSYMPAITNTGEYERVFRCRPVAKSRKNAITFDSSFWNEPVITANYELQHFLKEKMTTALNAVKNTERLSDKISSYLIGNAYLGVLSLEETAANFHMSPRTMQRRLKEEEVSFQQLADRARQDLAVQALEQGRYTVKEIAYMMGYNELSAFSRAFKRWTGRSPETYRLNISAQ
jgi:AraC-like DNA-binding protein